MKFIFTATLAFLITFTTLTTTAATTILAGGCFWCMESDFEKVHGVSDVISGFLGGTAENPTYSGDHSGHYEAVKITYDPKLVSYQQLLEHFWVNIDPFDDKGQFCDKGHSYLSAVFTENDEERSTAEATRNRVIAMFPDQKVVTPILDSDPFYPIKGDEAYHQDYYKNYPNRYKFYRWSCKRDARLREIWGEHASKVLQ